MPPGIFRRLHKLIHGLERGRTAFDDRARQAIVIIDRSNVASGTADDAVGRRVTTVNPTGNATGGTPSHPLSRPKLRT